MKKTTQAVRGILFVAAVILAFYAGGALKEKEERDSRQRRCQTLLSFAVDKLDSQDLSEQGVREALLSDLYAAYEYCDKPQLAAEIHAVWNALVFDSAEDESALSSQLEILSEAINADSP